MSEKRFLLFAAQRHLEMGGWGDFKGAFATLADAYVKYRELEKSSKWEERPDWYQIVDRVTLEVVEQDLGW